MKFKKGEEVYSITYNYWYLIVKVDEKIRTYDVKNLSLGTEEFRINLGNMTRFETDCVTKEVYKSPLYKVMREMNEI